MLIPSGGAGVKDFAPNRMYPGVILGDGFRDYGMCVCFRAPHSFTGEDVAELHCHGGIYISRGVLAAALKNGARMATNGEFTKRAFLNGKLSLASAEGMIDMINATSLAEVRAGFTLYNEKLTAEVRRIQSRLKDILASVAADVDYPEEDVAATDLKDLGARLEEAAAAVRALTRNYGRDRKIKSGITCALCGAPNVGKSSLLNALLGYDKAIVSPLAGTTRDAVEGVIEIDGLAYHLTDTAGLRDGADEIESIGISIAKKAVRSADLILYVCEGEYTPLAGVEEDDPRLIKIYNKCDVAPARADAFDISVSARTGENLDKLRTLMAEKAVGREGVGTAYVVEERHYEALCRADGCLRSAVGAIDRFPLDVISIDITDAWSALGEITGETANEEIIDRVFAKFCVGK